ncbi:uncharacterized protein LOC126144345 [Schistocerca cancellata]|uniref:uncharacterized protein LOC126144345 n=1 Tax=Schistocerca cancellata TaxID=274614 RepID=UPI002117A352|nr:uncharacterized protein LOC126144345 [Schistocerca cancellata]
MARSLLPSQLLAQCGNSLLVLLLVCLPAARAISCYQCNSFEDPDCDKITMGNATYDRLLKPCDGDYNGAEPFCRKMVQTLHRDEPVVRVRRTCSWERSRNPCYQFEDDDHLEVVCQCFADGCNAATAPASLGVATLLSGLASVTAFLRPH